MNNAEAIRTFANKLRAITDIIITAATPIANTKKKIRTYIYVREILNV